MVDQSFSRRTSAVSRANQAGWRFLGYFGWLLAVVGLTDVLLAWYPANVGDPTWEFGAVTIGYTSLPLLTMGLAAMLASMVALGHRWRGRIVAIVIMLFGLALLTAYVVFYLMNVPVALELTPPAVVVGLKKAIVKTSVLAAAFSLSYIAAGIMALRHFNSVQRRGE
jgi:hypothetical protein